MEVLQGDHNLQILERDKKIANLSEEIDEYEWEL